MYRQQSHLPLLHHNYVNLMSDTASKPARSICCLDSTVSDNNIMLVTTQSAAHPIATRTTFNQHQQQHNSYQLLPVHHRTAAT
jgi:hypothetical protein